MSDLLQRIDELLPLGEGITPGEWDWLIHDHSMASLGVMPDPGLGDALVMTASPCRACAKRAEDAGKEWEWGRCHTPSEPDAKAIAAVPKLFAALSECRRELETLELQHDSDRKLIEHYVEMLDMYQDRRPCV